MRLTVVRSRVGRRVAGLFVLSGLVPLLVLAGATSSMVSNYLERQERDRLRVLAKESAMSSLDRLLDAEDRLRVIAAQPAASIPPTALRNVAALARIDRQGRAVQMVGRLDPPALDAADRTRLAEGRSILRLPSTAGQPIRLVVPASGVGRYDGTAMVAALEPRTMWGFDERASDGAISREVCAAVDGQLLACTDDGLVGPGLPQLIAHPSGAGPFELTHGDAAWMGAHWSAPIRTPFGATRWTSVVLTRTADAMAPARALIRTVVLVVVATLCVLTLVSLHQIRRLLDPIAQLRDATAGLSRGEFAARVDVRSGDELQALGESFNAMAGDLQRQFEQLHDLSVGTLEALARAIDAKSPWTAGHSTRVAAIAVAVGQAMRFDAATVERIRRGALLHDIGKIGIASAILDSPDRLTDEQMAIVREHPGLGARILDPLPHCADILPMVLQHHERFDGSGYPAGLAGVEIALDARVLAVADVYDAMTSDRPYRRGLPSRDAAVRISDAAGTHFDPDVVAAFSDAFRNRRIPTGPAEVRVGKSA